MNINTHTDILNDNISNPRVDSEGEFWRDLIHAPLNEIIKRLISTEDLDDVFPKKNQYEEHLLSLCQIQLKEAFERDNKIALYIVHDTLFSLYELHVCQPYYKGRENQHSFILSKLRTMIERAWIRAETKNIPATPPNMSADQLILSIKTIWSDHPASHHPLFNYLEEKSSFKDIKIFLQSDCALNIRFFDLIAMSLIGALPEVCSEIVSNLWDEAGRGNASQSHVNLFRRILNDTEIDLTMDEHRNLLDWSGLRGYNLFMMGAINRKDYYKSLGIMAITELMDPSQYEKLVNGYRRIGISEESFLYYTEHISVDIIHGEGWLENVIRPIAERHPEAVPEILLGCYLRVQSANDYYDGLYRRLLG